WILYIDADERLKNADRASVARLLGDADEVAFRVLLRPDSLSTPYLEYRLWRHDPRIRFAGKIHEKVVPAILAVSHADRRPFDGPGVLVFTDLVRLRRDRGEDPAELLAEARRLYPGNKLLWWVQGTVRLDEGRYVDALDIADSLLAVDRATLPFDGPAYD